MFFFCMYVAVKKADAIGVMNEVTKKTWFYIIFGKLLEQGEQVKWMGLENFDIYVYQVLTAIPKVLFLEAKLRKRLCPNLVLTFY